MRECHLNRQGQFCKRVPKMGDRIKNKIKERLEGRLRGRDKKIPQNFIRTERRNALRTILRSAQELTQKEDSMKLYSCRMRSGRITVGILE
jgi:hypothetical protein